MAPPPGPDPSAHRDPSPASGDASLLEAAWSGLEKDLGAERGPAGRLRRLSGGARRALAALVALAFPVLVVALRPRDDLASVSLVYGVAWAIVLLPLAIAGVLLATRPLQARAVEQTLVLALTAASALSAAALVAFPLGAHGPPDPEGHGPFGCAVASLVVGSLVFAVLRVLRRDAIGAAVGAAVTAGASALATAALACPMDGLAHLMPGHALPVLLLAAAGLAIERR